MSRIMVFDLDNRIAGEVHGIVNRGWAINEGGQTTITLPESSAGYEWLQFGRYVAIEHPDLGLWAGMIDPPWKAIGPVQLTIYDLPYALSLRCVESGQTFTGTVGGIVTQILEKVNRIEDLFLRPGQISLAGTDRAEKITSGGLWEQTVNIVKNAGMEIGFQPVMQSDGTLIIEVNVQERLGEDVDFVLQDGEGGNAQISDATVEGQIINRMKGSSGESTETSRIFTGVMMETESMALYRARNQVKVFNAVTSQTQLEEYTRSSLDKSKAPYLKITLNAADKWDTFRYLRIGNSMMLRGTRLRLPGGKQGWSGQVRISAMTYDESKNVVSMTVEGTL